MNPRLGFRDYSLGHVICHILKNPCLGRIVLRFSSLISYTFFMENIIYFHNVGCTGAAPVILIENICKRDDNFKSYNLFYWSRNSSSVLRNMSKHESNLSKGNISLGNISLAVSLLILAIFPWVYLGGY